MTSSREKRGAGDHRRPVRVVGPDRDGGEPGLPQRRLRSRRLRLRTLRLRSRDVNVAKAPRPERRPRLAASARRAQLVEVGRRVFAERGYEATSVEEIAERGGISKPIVYEHFGGKEGLYAVIVDREIEHIVSCIVEAISSGSPRERLERAALAFLTYVKERPGGFAVLLRDVPKRPTLLATTARRS